VQTEKSMPERVDSERREYERYLTDLEVEVHGRLQDGQPFCDHLQLQNISGGGVGLLTRLPHRYSIGQNLTLRIKLPSTDRIESFMLCKAIVKWEYPNNASDAAEQPTVIGLCIGERSIEHRERKPGGDAGDGHRR